MLSNIIPIKIKIEAFLKSPLAAKKIDKNPQYKLESVNKLGMLFLKSFKNKNKTSNVTVPSLV